MGARSRWRGSSGGFLCSAIPFSTVSRALYEDLAPRRTIARKNAELLRVCHDMERVAASHDRSDGARDFATLEFSGTKRSYTFDRDKVDYGMVRVWEVTGQVRVTALARVWGWHDFTQVGDITVCGGGDEVLEVKTIDRTCDQLNRVLVEALSPEAKCQFEFISWDR